MRASRIKDKRQLFPGKTGHGLIHIQLIRKRLNMKRGGHAELKRKFWCNAERNAGILMILQSDANLCPLRVFRMLQFTVSLSFRSRPALSGITGR